MKYKFIIIILSLTILPCKAQSTLPLYLSVDEGDLNYYKDIDNDLNKFEGTWLYTDELKTFKVIFKKREHIFNPYGNFYTDMIVGEYQYIENGIEQVSTLANIDVNPLNPYNNNQIEGSSFARCDECTPGQRDVLFLALYDPIINDRTMSMCVKIFYEAGGFKIKVSLRKEMQWYYENEAPTIPAGYLSINDGTYILNKQL